MSLEKILLSEWSSQPAGREEPRRRDGFAKQQRQRQPGGAVRAWWRAK